MSEITESELDAAIGARAAEDELRKAYTDAEVEALGKAGKAFKNPDGHYSYPIDNAADLKNAVQALGRASAAVRDEVKAYIKKRAGELKATSELPEDWRAGAEDNEQRAEAWDAEHREGPSFKDRHRALSAAIRNQPDGGALSAYLTDFDDDTATYESGGSMFQVPYTEKDDGTIGLGDAQEVQPVTSYQPVDSRNVEDDAELEKRRRVREAIEGTVERRDFAAEDVEIRETSDGGLRFEGYASVTETPYMVGGFEETFARGAFKRCLGEKPDVVLLVNHAGLPLARTRSGTMTLTENVRGLKVDADLDPTDPDVQALLPKMRRGDLTEMSFAFRATQDEWSERDTKRVVRAATIHKGDVSMVTHGANTATDAAVSMRSDSGSFEILFEERIGKALSNAKKQKLEAIKGEIDEILGAPDEPEPQPVPTAGPNTDIIPSGIEAARAAKARLARRAA
jgi:HK97 family phage prohead protease